MKPGTLLADRYRIEGPLGSGGMGQVWVAVHEGLGQRVALKLLKSTEGPGAVERFRREAQILARLRGEHVARATDFGSLPSGELYLVLEHLVGQDLARVLRGGPLPVPVGVGYALQVCEALSEAHAAGLVHRDIKPPNLFLTTRPDGTSIVKVLDFGIAREVRGPSAAREEITTTGMVVATVSYASPEQLVSSKHVTAATDQFSLAATLYEMITGARAFPGETHVAMAAVLSGHAPNLRERVPEAPEGLAEVVARALAKRPEDRFPSIAAFARALAPFAPAELQVHAERASRALNEASERPSLSARASPPPSSEALGSSLQNAPTLEAHEPSLGEGSSRPGFGGASAPPRPPLERSEAAPMPSTPAAFAEAPNASPASPGPSRVVYVAGALLTGLVVLLAARKALTRAAPTEAAEAVVPPPPPPAPATTKAPPEMDPIVPEPSVPVYVAAFDAAPPAPSPSLRPAWCSGPNAKRDARYKSTCMVLISPLEAAIRDANWPMAKSLLLPRMSSLGCGDLQTLKTACRETGDPCAKAAGQLRLDKGCVH
ncbi:MAG: protein kinase [Myxococcales bacterium]|nr:protein kinase [Myxococcales bacterium]